MNKYLTLLEFFSLCTLAHAQEQKTTFPFNNLNLSVKERVDDLVSRMTLAEKIGQMQNTAPAVERLGIPIYNWWNECLHGVARNGIATVFPQAIAMAATWNPDLILQEADVISTEARAKYAEAISKNQHGIYQGLTFWSPNISIFRDPRWGRGQETYGEDPFLTAKIGTAFVKGLQGNDPKYFKVIATAKHFAVHSGPEPERHLFDAWPSETDSTMTLLWGKPDSCIAAMNFEVYQNGSLVAIMSKANFTATGLIPGKSYSFFIKTKATDGKRFKASKSLIIKTKEKGEVFNVLSFGAKGDGITKNTKAIQEAINAYSLGGQFISRPEPF